MYKTSRLARISLLISNLNKEFSFFSGRLFYESNKKTFFLCLHSLIQTLDVMQTLDYVSGLLTVSNSPNPSRVYIKLCKHRKKVFQLLKYCFFRKILLLCRLQEIYLKTLSFTVHKEMYRIYAN